MVGACSQGRGRTDSKNNGLCQRTRNPQTSQDSQSMLGYFLHGNLPNQSSSLCTADTEMFRASAMVVLVLYLSALSPLIAPSCDYTISCKQDRIASGLQSVWPGFQYRASCQSDCAERFMKVISLASCSEHNKR